METSSFYFALEEKSKLWVQKMPWQKEKNTSKKDSFQILFE